MGFDTTPRDEPVSVECQNGLTTASGMGLSGTGQDGQEDNGDERVKRKMNASTHARKKTGQV